MEEERDTRSVEEVLDAAAKRLGEPATPAASLRAFEANGVKFAWQMSYFSDDDWDKLNLSLGVKTAAKAELVESSVNVDGAPTCVAQDEVTDRMRRFLLLPDADGRDAKPLREMSALFCGLLTTPESERQSLLLALCELMALVSGLFLSIPFELRPRFTAPSSAAANTWAISPTREDGMDALVALIFIVDFFVAVFAVVMALYVAAGGHQADGPFCEGVMTVLGVLFMAFIVGVFFPLLILCFWRFFNDAVSPYPMLACLVLMQLVNIVLGSATQRFFCGPLALEFYHTPKWFLNMCRSHAPIMGTAHLIGERPLRAAAERRAAKLREQMMDQANDLAPSTDMAPAAVPVRSTGGHLEIRRVSPGV